jgi:TM2 domain-containing membrane protein YozV
MNAAAPTHSTVIGYVLWILGFTGSHRIYYGKPPCGQKSHAAARW